MHQVSKFSILGGQKEYWPKLLEAIDEADIPVQYGGTDETCDFLSEHGAHEGCWSIGGYMPSVYGPKCKTAPEHMTPVVTPAAEQGGAASAPAVAAVKKDAPGTVPA